MSDPGESPGGPARGVLQRSTMGGRSYFVFVLVFFHMCIMNGIAQLYENHNNGGEDPDPRSHQGAPDSLQQPPLGPKKPPLGPKKPPLGPKKPPLGPKKPPLRPQKPALGPREPETVREFFLPRIDGVKVGHVQKLSLVPDKVHEMRTLSLKPLLFEIPGFLSDAECGVVMQLAQLKGLVESQLMVQEGQEELAEELDLSPDEIFSLLDISQDGQLQLSEILTHSRVREGIWLTPESLREIYAGIHADKDHNGLLSLEEFRQLSSDAFQRFLLQRGVESSQLVRNSHHTWLEQGPGAHPVLQSVKQRVVHLTQLPDPLVDLSEPLQVVRYQQGGHYHAHHDSGPVYPETACTHTRPAANASSPFETSCRYITVLFYLNSVEGGGETAFPVADNGTYEEVSLIQNDVDLLDTRRNCERSNLRVKPTRGTALFWYNYLSDGKGWVGEQDQYSLHGGCVVTRGTKWVANKWINIDPDYQRQVRYQQLVSQSAQDHKDQEGLVSSQDMHDAHQDL